MNGKILVYRTSVTNAKELMLLSIVLNSCAKIKSWNIDLEDWEKVLRVECSKNLRPEEVIEMIQNIGICISELE